MNAMDAANSRRRADMQESRGGVSAKLGRVPALWVSRKVRASAEPEKRSRVADPHSAFATRKRKAKERAEWWESHMKNCLNATEVSSLEGAEAALFAWTGGECNRPLGQEPSLVEERFHGSLVRKAKEKELGGWKSTKCSHRRVRMLSIRTRWTLVGLSPEKWWMERDGGSATGGEGISKSGSR